jgi:trk system potassium uptake protein TrkA
MARQTLVIGLGQFGMSLARALAEHGSEVMAVDTDEQHIAEIAPHVAAALAIDATEEEALASLDPASRDVCVCAIGDDNREASIIVTALLKQLGARKIVARATDPLHARILALIGAHEVVSPERDFGQRLAVRLAWRHVVNHLPLGGDLVLTEIAAPASAWGRSLQELDLTKRFSIIVAAVLRESAGHRAAHLARPDLRVEEGDILLLVSAEGDARRLTERL